MKYSKDIYIFRDEQEEKKDIKKILSDASTDLFF